MARVAHAGPSQDDADNLPVERASDPLPTLAAPQGLTPKIWAVMAVTSLSTFGALTTGYELFFSRQLFA